MVDCQGLGYVPFGNLIFQAVCLNNSLTFFSKHLVLWRLTTKSKKQSERNQQARISTNTECGASPTLSGMNDWASLGTEKQLQRVSDDEEEEQGRPDKKKRMDAKMKQFIRDQFKAVSTKEQVEEIGLRMAKNEERIIENAESIARTTETVGKLRDSIAKIEQEIISERRGLEKRVERAVDDAMKKDRQRGMGGADKQRQDEFELARKSLRIWPIIWAED